MVCFKAKKIPLYIQAKKYIEKNIEQGNWPVGFKLPSERDLAKNMNVSRKTISMAYKELESDGLLSSHQGRGTFVVTRPAKQRDSSIAQLTEAIDQCIDMALSNEMTLDDFLTLCNKRTKEYAEKVRKLNVIFVECNKEQLDYFCKELEFGAGVHINPILLQDFKKNINEIIEKIDTFDFLITTLFHIDEVKSLVKDKDIKIIPIALNPQLESIIKIARIEKDKSVGILAISSNFAHKVERAISQAGLSFKNIILSTTKVAEEIENFVNSVDVVIVSPGRKKDITPLKDKNKIIEFIFVPDAGSINLLKTSIISKASNEAL